MAGAIRGITVEIGGDTTKLGKALADVNKKTKDLQGELKGVNTLLKMDPGNVTLLKQKQDLLTESISNTKSKLETLKEAEKQVQKQFEKGEVTEEQYRDLQREIIATEKKLESLNDDLIEFGSVGAQRVALVGDKFQEAGGKIENAGKKMSGLSIGATAVMAGSIVAFTDLDAGYDTIITKTGATGDALEGLNSVADNIFGSMPTDMESVGVAVGEINTRFGYTGEKLDALSRQFIQFAEINGVDLNNSIGTVDKILEQFNLTGDDAGGVLDLITKKAQETGISADTLMSLIQDNGATFKDMGIGVNEAVVMLSQFEANGVNVETAVKGLRKATVEYTKDGLSMEKALGKTINKIKNAKTDTEALALAQEVFGTKGAGEMAKAIREGRISVDDLSVAMEAYGGTVKDTYNATLDPIDDSTVAMNNLKLAGSELGGSLQETFAPILTDIVNKLKELVDAFNNLSPPMKKLVSVITVLTSALAPVTIAIGKVVSAFGSIMKVAPKLAGLFTKLKTAFSGLGAVFASNPIGIIIVAITALVGAFIYLWNNCEEFREFWINLWEQIKTALGPVIDFIKNLFSQLWEHIKVIWNALKTSLTPLFEAIIGAFKEGWELIKVIWDKVKPYFEEIWNRIKAIFAVVKPILEAYFKNAWIAIKAVWSVAVSFFKTIWENIKIVFSVVKTFFAEAFKTAWVAIKAVWNGVVGYFTAIWNSIKGVFSVVKNVLTGNWRGAWEGIKGIVNTWKGYFAGVWKSIKNVFSSVKSWFGNTFAQAWGAVKRVFSNWGQFFSGLWNTIKNTFSKIGTNIADAIGGAVKAGINGVISSIESIINKAIGLINGAINVINEIPGVDVGKISKVSFKRLAKGGIVDKPTFAEIGEDGREAVIPLENNTGWIRNLASQLNALTLKSTSDAELLNKLDNIYNRLNRLQVVLDSRALVGEIIDPIDAGLADRQILTARGV